jgi:F-type H+-transporting ATPase subunit b
MFGIGTAWAADGAHDADHGGIFSDPTFWVAIAFLIFVGFAGRKIWGGITSGLDKRSESIAKSVADAERLRSDALQAKAEAERTLAQATAEAEGILSQAREEVKRLQDRAAANLEVAVALREQQAKDRIAQAEAAATKDVRDTAVDVALTATRALLREQVGAGKAQTLVDEAIAELPRRLH